MGFFEGMWVMFLVLSCVGGLALGLQFISWVLGFFVRPELEKKQKAYLREKALPYKKHLAKKRMQLITVDDYGDEDRSKWQKEIVTFFNNKIGSIPGELALDTESKTISANEIGEIIEQIAIEGMAEIDGDAVFNENMDGIEYEHFCADILKKSGWDAKVSQASGDQGVDILAGKDGKKIAIQCKKYSTPVGNKAVQEVVGGLSFYGADRAVVVTNNSYTTSAKQLANSNNVLLLHHSDLIELEVLAS